MESEITLLQILEARETRAFRQQALLTKYHLPLVSFTLNIAGPVKNSPVLRRAFQEGLNRLEDALARHHLPLIHQEQVDEPTGCEALWVVSGDGGLLKQLCIQLEDEDALGRLFDLDVLDMQSTWNREQLGYPPRPCLVCGQPGKGCASRRVHSVEELQQVTQGILRNFFAQKDQDWLASQACRALLYEACTTPKPGLVDCANCGSHRDMDLFTFLTSSSALFPYFRQAAALGMEYAHLPPNETFSHLRTAGQRAERAMFQATGGVNTHKGAIFSLGCVCAAAGRLWTVDGARPSAEKLLSDSAAICRDAVEGDLASITPETARTAGQRLYLSSGLRGIRGELSDGLPSVAQIGLPSLHAARNKGYTLEEAGCITLLQLIAHVQDSNLVARGGPDGQHWAAQQCQALLPSPSRTQITELDQAMIHKNLSPGGCADLLAITYFLYFLGN